MSLPTYPPVGPEITREQALLRFFGINIYSFDPEVSRAYNIMEMQRSVTDMLAAQIHEVFGTALHGTQC